MLEVIFIFLLFIIAFADVLFPHTEDFPYLYGEIENLLNKTKPSLIKLVKFLKNELDDLQRKERAIKYYFHMHPELK